MIVKMYQVSDGDNVLNKTLEQPIEFNIKPRRGFDISNPMLMLRYDNPIIESQNYLVIEDLNRNYFIESVTNEGNNLYRVNCRCDVLETYKENVLNSQGRFYRKIKTGDYISSDLIESSKADITTHESDSGLVEGNTMLLTTMGAPE